MKVRARSARFFFEDPFIPGKLLFKNASGESNFTFQHVYFEIYFPISSTVGFQLSCCETENYHCESTARWETEIIYGSTVRWETEIIAESTVLWETEIIAESTVRAET